MQRSLARFSLVLITSNRMEWETFITRKTSLRLWQDLNFSFSQLYAKYSRYYQFPKDQVVCYQIVELSDCPRCIISLFSKIWTEKTQLTLREIPLPAQYIHGRVFVHKSQETTLQTSFILSRSVEILAPDGSGSTSPRAPRKIDLCKPKPSPFRGKPLATL
jgi:hypothetical protein